MPQAVRYTEHGDVDVLQVVDVERPVPGPGQVLVEVKAAGINPGEVAIRTGAFAARFPSTFPSGQGSDLAGVVVELGEGVEGRKVGDQVIGWVDSRSSHAEFAVVEAENLVERPSNVGWDVAGALFVAGTTAYAAVQAVRVREGDVVVVSGAAGGVGSIVVQLAKDAGATVIGIASESNHAWLAGHGVIPVTYGDGVADRIKAAANGKVDAFIDTFGSGYVKLALDLGLPADRIDTIIDFEAVEKYGVKADGNAQGATAQILGELVALVSKGSLEIPIAKTYPLAEVKAAFRDLEQRHTRGKIVLKP
jgi:NADPH:quinone reductase-like Zn-dependent oxidoreductase